MAPKRNTINFKPEASTTISSRWQTPIKILWLVLAILALASFVIYLPSSRSQLQTECTSYQPDIACIYGQLDPDGAQTLADNGMSLAQYADFYTGVRITAEVIALLIALIIFLRKSDDKMALLVATFLLLAEVATLPGTPVLATISPLLAVFDLIFYGAQAVTLVMFLYLFPDWRFVPPWTRWLLYAFVAIFAARIFLPGSGGSADDFGGIVWFIVFLTGIGLQIYRYMRISDPLQKEQTKWVVTALILAILLDIPMIFGLFSPGSVGYLVALTINEFFSAILALGFFIAILRYRLWDIEVVANRAMIYGALSAVLAGIFAGSIALINQGTKEMFGTQATASAAVVSALIVATFFQPLRSRIEKWVNKRFYPDTLNLSKEFIEFSPDVRNLLSTRQLAGLVTERINALVNCRGSAIFWQNRAGKFEILASAAEKNTSIGRLPPIDPKQKAELSKGQSLAIASLGAAGSCVRTPPQQQAVGGHSSSWQAQKWPRLFQRRHARPGRFWRRARHGALRD